MAADFPVRCSTYGRITIATLDFNRPGKPLKHLKLVSPGCASERGFVERTDASVEQNHSMVANLRPVIAALADLRGGELRSDERKERPGASPDLMRVNIRLFLRRYRSQAPLRMRCR